MFIKVKQVAIAVTAVVTMSAPAMAATIIDFRNGTAGAGGSVTFDGTNAVGENLPIGLVEVFDAPNAAANDVFAVYGTATSSNTGGNYGDLDFNTGDNTVSIVGCIPGLGLGSLDANGMCTTSFTLLSGTISGENINAPAGAVSFFGPDSKHPALLEAIGLAPNTPFELFGFTLLTGSLTAGGAGQQSISTDIRNNAIPSGPQNTPVPEPATMMLLGTGLLAAFRARRKQQA
jgi:hypothetical protein